MSTDTKQPTVTRQQLEELATKLYEHRIAIPEGIKMVATVDYDEVSVPLEMRKLTDIEYNTRGGIKFFLKPNNQ